MNGSARLWVPRLYCLVTPAFIALDHSAGVNMRVANRRQGWAFLIGMVLYLLDGLLFVLVQEWLSLAFHGFALCRMFRGCAALRQLCAAVPPGPGPPPESARVPDIPAPEVSINVPSRALS